MVTKPIVEPFRTYSKEFSPLAHIQMSSKKEIAMISLNFQLTRIDGVILHFKFWLLPTCWQPRLQLPFESNEFFVPCEANVRDSSAMCRDLKSPISTNGSVCLPDGPVEIHRVALVMLKNGYIGVSKSVTHVY